MRDVCFRASGQQNLRDLIQANLNDGWAGMVTWLKNANHGAVTDTSIPKFVAKQVDKFEGKWWRRYVIGKESAITGVPIENVPATKLRQHGDDAALKVYTLALDPPTTPPLPTPLSSFHYIRHGTAVYRPMDNWDVFLTEETKATVQTLCPIFVAVLRLCIKPNSHIFLQTKRLRDLETKMTPRQSNLEKLKKVLAKAYADYVKSPENKQFHAIIFRDALRQLTDVRNAVSPPKRKFIEEWKAYHTPQLEWTCALWDTSMLQKQHEWLTGDDAKTLYGDSPQITYLKEVIQLQLTINRVNSIVKAYEEQTSLPKEKTDDVFRTLQSIVTSPEEWKDMLKVDADTMDFYGATWVRSEEAETWTSDELEEFHVFDAADVLCDVGWEKDSENKYLYVVEAEQLLHALPLGPNLVISGPEGNEQQRYLLPGTPSFTDREHPERYPYAYALALRRLYTKVVNSNASADTLMQEDIASKALLSLKSSTPHTPTSLRLKVKKLFSPKKLLSPKTQRRTKLKVVHVMSRRRRRWKQTQPISFGDLVRGRKTSRDKNPRSRANRSRTPSYARVDEFQAKIEAVLSDIIPKGILHFDYGHQQDSGNAPTLYVYGSATYSHDANDLDVFYRCNTPIAETVVPALRQKLKQGPSGTFVFEWETGFTIDFHVVTTTKDVEKMTHVLLVNNFIRGRMRRSPYTLKFYEDSKVWCRAHGMYDSKLLLWRGVALALFSIYIHRKPTQDTVVDDEMRKFLYAPYCIAFAKNGAMTQSPFPEKCQSVSVVTFDGQPIFHTTPNILRGMWRSLSTRFFDTVDINLYDVPTVVNYESDYRYSALVDLLTSQFVCAKRIDLLPYVDPNRRVGFRVWAEEGVDATAAVDHVNLFTTALKTEGFSRGP